MSSFIEEMGKFTMDASNSKFYDFEFIAVPGYADSWIVRYSHQPKNPFLKYFFGSKPISIAQQCNCPVLIAK